MITARRGKQLTRTWQVIALLRSGGGCSLAKLATETGVCSRTIRRDLEALQDAGIAIYDVLAEDATVRLWRLVKGTPCAICGKGVATGKEYRQ